MKMILIMLQSQFKDLGSMEKAYLVSMALPWFINELKRIQLVWDATKAANYVSDSADLFIAEELAGANLIIAKINATATK